MAQKKNIGPIREIFESRSTSEDLDQDEDLEQRLKFMK